MSSDNPSFKNTRSGPSMETRSGQSNKTRSGQSSAGSRQSVNSNAKRNTADENVKPFSNQTEFDAFVAPLREQGFTHVPIVAETLADLDTPVSTYLKLADQPFSYLFESVQGGDKWGRYSIIGLPCDTHFRFDGYQLSEIRNGEIVDQKMVADPLTEVRVLQQRYRVADYPGLPEMIGGLVGYFGYETIGFIESKLQHQMKPDDIGSADILLMVSKDVLVFDNLLSRMFIVTLADLDEAEAYQKAQRRLTKTVKNLRDNVVPTASKHSADDGYEVSPREYQVHFAQAEFEAAVEQCRHYIRDGDIMQIVLSQRLSTPYTGSSFDVYRALRTINPSPYMYFINLGELDIVGSSPEILVRVQDDTVTVRPIAGTRKRGATVEQDLALEKELLSDEKELAEHIMLIDLGRNDVGRIAKIGSVKLTEKMAVERYSHVMHIVSNVDGRLQPEFDAIDVLKATFPAGTVSGAPKIRAMEIIAELEPIKRGIYSGAIGYLGWHGNMDTAIAIRTAVIKDGILNIQAGAGIVADSVPEYEWKETLSKARVMFSAVEMATSGLSLTASLAGKDSRNLSEGGT
jgi:anthranilate synthase component 1